MKDRIRKLREECGLSRKEFGEKMYVSQDVINNVERGRVEPTGLLIKCICDTYGVKEDWLRSGPEEEPQYIENDDDFKMIERLIKENGGNLKLKSFLLNWMELSPSNQSALESLSAHMVEESKKK